MAQVSLIHADAGRGVAETVITLLQQGGNYKFDPHSEVDGDRVDPRVRSDRIVSGTTSV